MTLKEIIKAEMFWTNHKLLCKCSARNEIHQKEYRKNKNMQLCKNCGVPLFINKKDEFDYNLRKRLNK